MPPVEIPARLSGIFVRESGVTMFFPQGAARGGYVVDSDERLRRLIAEAWCRVPTTRAWVLWFFAWLLVAPFVLFAVGLFTSPAGLALVAAAWLGGYGWSVHRFRDRVAPLVRDLPRIAPREASLWALTSDAVAATIRRWGRSPR